MSSEDVNKTEPLYILFLSIEEAVVPISGSHSSTKCVTEIKTHPWIFIYLSFIIIFIFIIKIDPSTITMQVYVCVW